MPGDCLSADFVNASIVGPQPVDRLSLLKHDVDECWFCGHPNIWVAGHSYGLGKKQGQFSANVSGTWILGFNS